MVGCAALTTTAASVSAKPARPGRSLRPIVGAGAQKLIAGGLFADHTLQAHILSHHQVDDTSIWGNISGWIALDPTLSAVLALATAVIQVGAWIFLLGPRARVVWGSLLIAFHLATLAILHIIYIEATVLLAAWTYPWSRLAAFVFERMPKAAEDRSAEVPDDAPISARAGLGLSGVALAIVAFIWQLPTPRALADNVRATQLHETLPAAPGSTPAEPPQQDSHQVVDAFGPLRVGDAVGSFAITELAVHRGEVRVVVAHGTTQVTFGTSGQSGSAHAGPHSRDDLRVYVLGHDWDESIDAAGTALSERLRAGVERPGATVDAWIVAAWATRDGAKVPGLGG